jgi:transcriptional regulator with XRE-family HTH domain
MTLLGNHIIRLRNARGWTRVDLAAAAGVPHTTIRNIEKGQRSKKPQEQTIRAIAAALGNDADVMLVLAGYGTIPSRTPDQVMVELDALGEIAPRWKDAIERVKNEMSPADQELALDVLLAQLSAAQRRSGGQ